MWRNGDNAVRNNHREGGPEVHIILPDSSTLDEVGKLVFIDNRIDPTMGTIAVRAEFPNKKDLIVDGAFLNVQLAGQQPVERTLVPQAAIQRDQ